MTSDAKARSFANRNGFARRTDLEDPLLRRLRRLCEDEDRAIGGRGQLGWSRQWEYPYTLANIPEDGGGLRILDAGSGYRFFTFMLAKRGFDLHACDLDASIGPRIRKTASKYDLSIDFTRQDLSNMDYPDALFDYVACISVLEHTGDPQAVVKELQRILKPGGRLLVTFDVSLDGDRDIPIEKVQQLLKVMERRFVGVYPFEDEDLLNTGVLNASEDILTTQWFREHAPELLPWRMISKTGLRNMVRGTFGRPFFSLSVMGMVLAKKADDARSMPGHGAKISEGGGR